MKKMFISAAFVVCGQHIAQEFERILATYDAGNAEL